MISTRDALVATLGALLVQMPAARLASAVLLDDGDIGAASGSAHAAAMAAYLLIPSLAGIAWIWFFAVWREADGWMRVGLYRPNQATLLRAVIAGLAGVLLVNIVIAITPDSFGTPMGPIVQIDHPVEGSVFLFRLVYILGAVVVAPVFEELVFRGLLFSWVRRRFAFLGSAVIAALPHAAIHGDPAAIPALTAVFVLFAWIFERERTLWASIVAHGTYNATVLVMVLMQIV